MIYKSCRLLEHGIYFYLDPGSKQLCVGHCCNTDNYNLEDRLYLYFDLKNETLDWDYIFHEKQKLRENAEKGTLPKQCEGCFELHDRNWDDENYISHLTAGHIMKCNSRCIYCYTGRESECHSREQDVDIRPVITELLNKNLLRFNGSLRFVGGEPTLMKEFDWLVDLFSEHNVPEIYVPTSGIRLSKSLCKALEKVNDAAIVVSVDSGSKETFEKVKGTKFYNVVLNNLKTYLKHAKESKFIIPKFILLTEYNDTSKEIDNWLQISKKTGHTEVQFDAEHTVASSEHCENKKFVNRTLNMLKYTELLAKKYGLKVTSYLAFMNRTKQMHRTQAEYFLNHRSEFIDLRLTNHNTAIDINQKYADIYIDLDGINYRYLKNTLEQLFENENFAVKRTAYLISSNEITKIQEFKDIAYYLLRLGFNIELKTGSIKYSEPIDEIIKTSYSTVTFSLKVKKIFGIVPVFNIFKRNKFIHLYKTKYALGKINVGFEFDNNFSESEKEKFINKYKTSECFLR